MKQSRTSRRRAIALALFAFLPALLLPSGIAGAASAAQPGVDITICHATGSATNPYVTITINPNGLNGHLNTPHSGTDIVPAPAGGCPGPVTPPPPTDVCPNVAGNQATVPAGLVVINGQCVAPPPPPTDVCPNLDGNQATIPAGLVLIDGQCLTPPVGADICPNIAGDQPTLPAGLVIVGGQCVAPITPATPDAPTPAAPTPDAPTPDATPEAAGGDTPAPAADDTTVQGVAEVPAGEPTAGAAETAGGTLPFTGAPTWVLAVAGMLFMLAGTILHRRGSRRTVATSARN